MEAFSASSRRQNLSDLNLELTSDGTGKREVLLICHGPHGSIDRRVNIGIFGVSDRERKHKRPREREKVFYIHIVALLIVDAKLSPPDPIPIFSFPRPMSTDNLYIL